MAYIHEVKTLKMIIPTKMIISTVTHHVEKVSMFTGQNPHT